MFTYYDTNSLKNFLFVQIIVENIFQKQEQFLFHFAKSGAHFEQSKTVVLYICKWPQ